MIEGILIEGLIYGLMVMGLFITFRVLNFCDMTVDGTFPMGGAVMAALLIKGVNPVLALLAAFFFGMIAGLVTAIIHNKFKLPDLLSGILTMTMLYSVNLRIMSNRANIQLLRVNTLFTGITARFSGVLSHEASILVFMVIFAIVLKFILDVFFHTDFGLSMGVLGSNVQLIISQGMNPAVIKTIGICLGNGLTAVAGALGAMYQGFADVGSGTGIIVSGLASLMLGEFIVRSNKIELQTFRVLLGSIVYRTLMYLARSYGYVIGMTANDLKLITGLLIIICLLLSKTDIAAKIRIGQSRLERRRDIGADSNSASGKQGVQQ
ncbi:MAG: ABC transporter permease [Treponema sp.]|nr:ABC transporter permease [Treponema sp.]